MTRFLWDDAEFDNESALEPISKASKQSSRSQIKKQSVEELAAPGSDPQAALSVAELNAWIGAAIEANIKKVWVAGEISDCSQPRSGHVYLTLKDETAQIRAVIWRSTMERLKFSPEDGQAVVCFGRVDVYSPRGSYQMVIERLEPQGVGPLEIAFRQLHEKLQREGLFAPERKKLLPNFPNRIGFVTSPGGAAVRDFVEIVQRRWPGIEILVIPTRVQGDGAAQEIAKAVKLAQQVQPSLDILVVGRGGGSTEDLWCFNEEPVVRAIADCSLPTVSAVGHEIDVTLSDLAADLRAATPSEAAERIVPNQTELREIVLGWNNRSQRVLATILSRYRQRLDSLSDRPGLTRPEEIFQRRQQRLDEWNVRLEQSINRHLMNQQHRLSTIAASVEALSPLRTLQRGYSICRDIVSDRVVQKIDSIQVGSHLETQLSDGRIESIVTRLDPTSSRPD